MPIPKLALFGIILTMLLMVAWLFIVWKGKEAGDKTSSGLLGSLAGSIRRFFSCMSPGSSQCFCGGDGQVCCSGSSPCANSNSLLDCDTNKNQCVCPEDYTFYDIPGKCCITYDVITKVCTA